MNHSDFIFYAFINERLYAKLFVQLYCKCNDINPYKTVKMVKIQRIEQLVQRVCGSSEDVSQRTVCLLHSKLLLTLRQNSLKKWLFLAAAYVSDVQRKK